MHFLRVVGLLLALSSAAPAFAADGVVLKELAPTGNLQVGVAFAPAATPVFVVKDASGAVKGLPRELGTAIAKSLGVPAEFIARATTNELTDDCVTGMIDIGFTVVDDARRKRLDFSPPYFTIESTYLVAATSGITTIAEIDRAGTTAVGIDGSATMRAARNSLKVAKIVAAPSVAEAMAMMKAGTVQALALTHDSLPALQKELPGSRILDGAFTRLPVAISVQKNKPAALTYLRDFIETAKANGSLRYAFDEAGLKDLPTAPPERN
jgi:polar amino acid transport system substrate-binding protein